jgi:hypothetical protein
MRPSFTRLALHSQRVCLLFSFANRNFRLSALEHHFLLLCLVYSNAADLDPFDLLRIVLLQVATVQQEHHLCRLLALQVS